MTAALMFGAALALRATSPLFGYDVELVDMPILTLVGTYSMTGIFVMIAIPALIRRTNPVDAWKVLAVVLLAGLAMRFMQFGVEPVLEDDYNRYLWDGALTANGFNPFVYSPEAAASSGDALSRLRTAAGEVFDRINYPEYRTVYPPTTQAAFAIAHVLSPFNLDGWRSLSLLLEAGCVATLIGILNLLGRSPLWVSLYWLHSVSVKELANSAHMETTVILPVLLGAWLAIRQRAVFATGLLAIAAGAKLWPALLIAPVMRRHLAQPGVLIRIGLTAAIIMVALGAPVLMAGLDDSSGFVAYAQKWRASSASFLVSEWIATLAHPLGINTGVLARALLAGVLAIVIAGSCLKPIVGNEDLLHRLFVVAAALFLLSPSVFPWYFLWVLPFLCISPVRGLLLAGALLPFHYLYFHFDARGAREVYTQGLVWMVWLPVWTVLAFDLLRSKPIMAGRD